MTKKIVGAWELWAILSAQAAITVPWLWRTAPFSDEALYLQAGHAEWAHWLHHAAIPNYPVYFSGAPTVYPPLAAAADSLGGLPAARTLSLIFMLISTVLVYLIARRLVTHMTGVLAALLFALCGLDIHYGAFATYGPMAGLCVILAAYAALRIREGAPGWLALCAVSMVAANATKYATIAWDPVVVTLIVLHGWQDGRRLSVLRATSVTATSLITGLALLMIGGESYARGLVVTTLFRHLNTFSTNAGLPTSMASVALRAFAMTGLIVVPAALGIVVSVAVREPRAVTLILCLLVLAALLAPIEQARIHQLQSLDKNVAFGLPFAAVAAGYAVVVGGQWLARRWSWGGPLGTGAAVGLVLAVIVAGRLQSVQFRGAGMAVATKVVATVRGYYRAGTFILTDNAARMEQYYLPSISRKYWIGTTKPLQDQVKRISTGICSGKISVVILRTRSGVFDNSYDSNIVKMLDRAGGYSLVLRVQQGRSGTVVWRSAGGRRSHAGARACG